MIKIFCEGIGDQIFIADFIESIFEVRFTRETSLKNKDKIIIKNEKIEIIPIDGCKKIKQDIFKDLFINNSDIGGKNILIFDADFTNVNGNNGFVNCSRMVEELKNHPEKPIIFEHYLWPNNQDDGLFEDLLIKIIPDKHLPVIKCISSHQECLSSLHDLNINVPGIKEKISYYLYMFNQDSKASKRRFNNEYWCLDINKCEELLNLKKFLTNTIDFEKL